MHQRYKEILQISIPFLGLLYYTNKQDKHTLQAHTTKEQLKVACIGASLGIYNFGLGMLAIASTYKGLEAILKK